MAIAIDSSLMPFYDVNYVFQNSKQDQGFYYGLNTKGDKYSIDVFDLQNQVFYKKINIDVSDTSQIRRVACFKVVNTDSIYLLETFPKVALHLINDNGKLINSWVVLKENPDSDSGLYIDYFANAGLRFLLTDDRKELILFCSSDHESDSYDSYQHAPLVKFNLTNYKFTIFGKYPKLYKNDQDLYYPFAQQPFVCVSDSLLYVSFMHGNQIGVYSIRNLTLKEMKCMSSSKIGNPPNRLSREKDFQSQSNFLVEYPFYKHLIYDKYTNTIFRFAKLGQPLYEAGTKLNHVMTAGHSVTIKNLRDGSLKEYLFPANKYVYNASSMTGGFIISNFNMFNPQVTEDSLVMTRFIMQ